MATVGTRPLRTGEDHAPPEARVLLQPIAAPSVLGYFALASALIIYGSWFAGGWGGPASPHVFFPFLLLFGGVGQFAAAMWSYRARNAVAAALHGSWSAFFLGVSIMYLLATTHTIVVPAPGAHFASLGQWFIYMAVITWTTAFAVLARSRGGFLAQATLAAAATIAAPALLVGSSGWTAVAGWVMVAAAAGAYAQGGALMLGLRSAKPVQFAHGDPGVKVGQ